MAIKIPSKNIYEISNPKVRDNVVNRIEVNSKTINKTYSTKGEIYCGRFTNFQMIQKDPSIVHEYRTIDDGLNKHYAIGGSYVSYERDTRLTNTTIRFPVLKDNSAIKSIYSNSDSVGVAIYGEYRYRSIICPFTGSMEFNYSGELTKDNFNIDIDNITNYGAWTIYTEKQYTVPNKIEIETQITMYGQHVGNAFTNSLSAETPYGNIDNLSFNKVTIDGEEYIEVTIYGILCGGEIIRMDGQTIPLTTYDELSNYEGQMSGTQRRYTPSYIEISFNGDTIKLDISEETVYIPNNDTSNKKVYSIDGSELMQVTNIFNGGSAIENIYNGTLSNYQNGKETATLLCDINDYYDESDKLKISSKKNQVENVEVSFESQIVISTIKVSIDKPYDNDIAVKVKYKGLVTDYKETYIYINKNETSREKTFALVNIQEVELVEAFIVLPMSFRLHDQVIPYVYGANGQDQPMSKYQDGTAKVFEVVGSNIIYDGAVWQELTLQEIYNNFTENT